MSTPSIESVHTLLVDISLDVKDLKQSKMDISLHAKDIEIIELKITAIARSVEAIKSYTKLVASTVIIAIVGALIQQILASRPR